LQGGIFMRRDGKPCALPCKRGIERHYHRCSVGCPQPIGGRPELAGDSQRYNDHPFSDGGSVQMCRGSRVEGRVPPDHSRITIHQLRSQIVAERGGPANRHGYPNQEVSRERLLSRVKGVLPKSVSGCSRASVKRGGWWIRPRKFALHRSAATSNRADSSRSARADSARAYRFAWWQHSYVPTTPVPYECLSRPPADAWRRSGETCGRKSSTPATRIPPHLNPLPQGERKFDRKRVRRISSPLAGEGRVRGVVFICISSMPTTSPFHPTDSSRSGRDG
jgi:hypothetical protein